MNAKTLRTRLKPHLWYQAYWVVYLIWFFWLDLTITAPKYIIHSPVDDLIPFNEGFIFPYCSWFVLLAAVTALLWWFDTASYDGLPRAVSGVVRAGGEDYGYSGVIEDMWK